MSFSTDYTTMPVIPNAVEPSVTGQPSNPKEEKVTNVAHELFSSSLFKQVMSVLGYIAVSLGSIFMLEKITNALSGKKIGEFPADAVAKAGVEALGGKAKEYIDNELKAEPLPPNVYNAIVRFQKEAEYREDTRRS